MPDADDNLLLIAAQQGNEMAWETLVRRHIDAVTASIAKRCPRWSLVDEVVQETFVRVWSGQAQPDGRARLRGWFVGVAHNVLLEELRRTPCGLRPLDDLLLDAIEDGDRDAREREEAQQAARMNALRCCLEMVDARGRRLLQARYEHGRPLPELARAYKCKTATVAKQIQRLAAALRGCMEGRLS